MKTGALLVNTGSPDSPAPRDVKTYLQEFLMDERVIDIPAWKRRLLVYGIIAPFRSKKVSKLYENIWTPEGSPLVATTIALAQKLTSAARMPVEAAMRYGNPSVKSALEKLSTQKVKKVVLAPMFPHYAMSTWESVVEKVKEEIKSFPEMNLSVVSPYYDHPDFIDALYQNARAQLKQGYDHIVFSFHSLPVRHILKADPTRNICLVKEGCCETKNPAQATCYKAQTLATTKLLMKKIKVDSAKASLTFQSAMRGQWLGPSTEEKIIELAHNGCERVLVICPGFVTDNLETLEEIGIRGKERFSENFILKMPKKTAAGKRNAAPRFDLVPSLNLHDAWVKTLAKIIKKAG